MIKNKMKSISFNIRRLRREKKMTQADLAQKIGITRQQIANYELGIGTIPLEKIIIMSDILDFKIDDILNRDSNLEQPLVEVVDHKQKHHVCSAYEEKIPISTTRRIGLFIQEKNMSVRTLEISIGASNGTIGRAINNGTDIHSIWISKIIENYPDINPEWLLTGSGEMLRKKELDSQSSLSKVPQLRYGQMQSNTQALNHQGRGVPFYDVDFIGGFQYIFNDQTTQPNYYIDIPIFNEADAWVNVTGESMNPIINNGDIVAIKQLRNWNEFILYGEIYGVVTEDFRTIKIIREEEEGCFLLTPYNQSQEFKAQRIPKNLIMHIFKVIGCVKRIF